MKSIIFDLDMTLVDSRIAENLRRQRNWGEVYKLINRFILYDGLDEIFKLIRIYKIKCAIVSSAPNSYVKKVVNYFSIPCDHIVAYHDCVEHKPSPECIIKAVDYLRVDPKRTISLGDNVYDIIASNNAGVESIACLWGAQNISELMNSDYSHAIRHPSEIKTLLR